MKTAVIYDKWLHQFGGAEVVACTMAKILIKAGWSITFVSGKFIHLHKIQDCFGINLKDIPFYVVWNNEKRLKEIVQGKDLFINLSFMDYSYGFAKKNIYYTHFPTPERSIMFNLLLAFFHMTSFHTLLPKSMNEKVYNRIRAGIFFDMKKRLDSYDTILANSEFTKKWIKNYWHKESTVLYPPVTNRNSPVVSHQSLAPNHEQTTNNLPAGRQGHQPTTIDYRPSTKHNWITSVGRFFTLGHGKKQEVLIQAFIKLCDELKHDNPRVQPHLTPGVTNLELHLVGGVGSEPSSIRFLEYLKDLAKGYPIFFHINIPHTEVLEILAKSKIYWHATGYGEDENTNPIAFEHFGIAPVEGIMSGCLPVFYAGGGLIEILDKMKLDKKAHLFKTVPELTTKTIDLLRKKPLTSTAMNTLHSSSFSEELFGRNFLDTISHA
ncbi:MAG: glycosyltransferase family 4 protein [Patescibacteria group bacterium]